MISVLNDFGRAPGGRFRSDGKFSGERFRDDFLVPALKAHATVCVDLDGTRGYGSSFLEEAFGGLVRSDLFDAEALKARLVIVSRDPSLVSEIHSYIDEGGSIH